MSEVVVDRWILRYTSAKADGPCRRCGSDRSIREIGKESMDGGRTWVSYVQCSITIECIRRRR